MSASPEGPSAAGAREAAVVADAAAPLAAAKQLGLPPVQASPPSAAEPFVFLHHEKCAGTSLRRYVARAARDLGLQARGLLAFAARLDGEYAKGTSNSYHDNVHGADARGVVQSRAPRVRINSVRIRALELFTAHRVLPKDRYHVRPQHLKWLRSSIPTNGPKQLCISAGRQK